MAVQLDLPYEYTPRDYQLPAWLYYQNGGKRGVHVWHRRAGKDLFAINRICVSAHERVGIYWHIFPTYKQGKKIAWNGTTNDGRKFIDYFPKELIESVNNTEMTIKFKNGSIYQIVGADDPDSLVGSNPIGCVFSEYSLMSPTTYDLIRPILSANDGWAMFIYTPRGHNFAYDLLKEAEVNPLWYAERLTVDDTKAVPMSLIDDDRRMGMKEPLVQQEYWVSFEAPIEGAYYANDMMAAAETGRIGQVPWDPILPVHTSWDLGMDDSMSLWFFQLHRSEIRLIDYYENSGEGLPFYVKMMSQKHRAQYRYGDHWLPHDVKVRELNNGKSRYETLRKLGVKPKVVPRVEDVHDRISDVRNVLSRCYFDEKNTKRGIQCLRSYRSQIDEKTGHKSTAPVHDWACHGADSFGGIAHAARKFQRSSKNKRQEKAIDKHDYRR